MLCRAEEECLPPEEWDREKAKVGWEWSQMGHCSTLLPLSPVWTTLSPYAWNRALSREDDGSPPEPQGWGERGGWESEPLKDVQQQFQADLHQYLVSQQQKSHQDSYQESLVFLFGLSVPSARPACKKELATLICRSFQINQYKCLQDYYNFPSNGSCPLTRKEIFSSLKWACWFQKKLNSSIPTKQIQSNHQGLAMLSSLLKHGKQQGLQMPPAKRFWYSAYL